MIGRFLNRSLRLNPGLTQQSPNDPLPDFGEIFKIRRSRNFQGNVAPKMSHWYV
jgi:hypothetical protein